MKLKNIGKSFITNNIGSEILAAMVVSLALIPEVLAFSIIAGVDPKIGLYSSLCITIVISITGGRPGMISAAAGAMALVVASLVKDYGLNYLLAATILTGIIQVIIGIIGLDSLIRFISRSVLKGFVNGLSILIFVAQLKHFNNSSIDTYYISTACLMIIYLFPYITKKIPSPLIAIIALTIFNMHNNLDLKLVGDMGKLPENLPNFSFPDININWESFKIILPYSLILSAVGLLESLMTSVIIDDFTGTTSQKSRECTGQGIANIIAGFFGGMAGCAMIGQSVINMKYGGRGRISTFFTGVFLFILVLILSNWVKQIPVAAIASVMFMVSISTFDWSSIKNFTINPRSYNIVMITTLSAIVLTHNLALGVLIGVIVDALLFTEDISKMMQIKEKNTGDDTIIYQVYGQIFFASANRFIEKFILTKQNIVIDMEKANITDSSGAYALEKVITKFLNDQINIKITGLNKNSAEMVKKCSTYNYLEQNSLLI